MLSDFFQSKTHVYICFINSGNGQAVRTTKDVMCVTLQVSGVQMQLSLKPFSKYMKMISEKIAPGEAI